MLISFQLALQVHCQALWQLPSQNSVPPEVTLTDRAHYNSSFSSESAIKSSVHASLDANSVDINEARSRVWQLLDSLVHLNSTTANYIQRINENFLCLMFRTVSFFGLARWAPDVLSQDLCTTCCMSTLLLWPLNRSQTMAPQDACFPILKL